MAFGDDSEPPEEIVWGQQGRIQALLAVLGGCTYVGLGDWVIVGAHGYL